MEVKAGSVVPVIWNPRARELPAWAPPNHEWLFAVKEDPVAGLTSASQNTREVGSEVSSFSSNEEMSLETGMFKVAAKLPLQLLFPVTSASQLTDGPVKNIREKLGSSPVVTVSWGGTVVVVPVVSAAVVTSSGPAVAGPAVGGSQESAGRPLQAL